MLRYQTVAVTPFQQNCSIIWCDQTMQGAVIDPGGDHATLIESIKGRLWPMGDETVFIPGHGPESSFGRERRSNPYLRSA